MSSSIPVNLIRQWSYCPRVVYYQEMTELSRVVHPSWVKQGEIFHEEESLLWQRRNLSRFNLKEGKKYHNLSIQSPNLGLHGIADMVIETDDTVYAVEFKLSTNNKKRGDVLQLVAYAMLIQQYFEKPSPMGFLIGKNKILHQIVIDQEKCEQVKIIVREIRIMMEKGQKPESSAFLTQCSACEYVNFCNDRL